MEDLFRENKNFLLRNYFTLWLFNEFVFKPKQDCYVSMILY